MVGAIASNLHEGSRSEYLAQYLFASFGTAVSVPHQEDSGIDLYCTLTERIGSRSWPRAYFSVQVKSTMDSWLLDGNDSVRWLVAPLPFFLCIVDKSEARIRVYQTSPRFYVWSMPPLPDHLELFPTTDAAGKCTQWEGSTAFSLSAPTPAMKYPDPVPVYQNLIVVSGETVLKAAKLVESCETCNSVGAEIPFDWILDQVTGSDSTVTDYIIESPAKCPTCQRPIFEKTLVEPRD